MPLYPSPAKINAKTDIASVISLLAKHDPQSLHEAASVAEMTEAETNLFLSQNGEAIAGAATRALLTGETLKPQAVRLMDKLLKAGLKLADTELMEPKEIKELASVAQREIEDDTRKELASKAHTDAVVVEIYFENGGVTGHVCQDTKPMVDVIDAAVKTVPVALDSGSTPVRGTELNPDDFIPVTGGDE